MAMSVFAYGGFDAPYRPLITLTHYSKHTMFITDLFIIDPFMADLLITDLFITDYVHKCNIKKDVLERTC